MQIFLLRTTRTCDITFPNEGSKTVHTLIRVMTDLWYVDSCGVVLLLLRLGYLRFYARYPGLMLFLLTDLVGGVVGLRYGTGSRAYYWSYFVTSSLLGSGLLIWMCREMFAELYYYHPGLRGATQCTLKRSLVIGAAVSLALAPPVGLIHWGDPAFQCWQFPFVEVHRCLTFGVVVFVVAMWNILRWLPLDVPSNVKVYTFATCLYLTCSGLVESAALIAHTTLVTLVCGTILLAVTLVFYVALAVLAEEPQDIPHFCFLPVDYPQEVFQLSSIARLFATIDGAQRRGRASALKRSLFFTVARSLKLGKLQMSVRGAGLEAWGVMVGCFGSALKACARAGDIILDRLQKD
jgi:hypothetical protein